MNKYPKTIEELIEYEEEIIRSKTPYQIETSHNENIIDILKKQIPKKPNNKANVYKGVEIKVNGIDGVPYDLCPNCDTNLCTSGFMPNNKDNYCSVCGQRLDWSKDK